MHGDGLRWSGTVLPARSVMALASHVTKDRTNFRGRWMGVGAENEGEIL